MLLFPPLGTLGRADRCWTLDEFSSVRTKSKTRAERRRTGVASIGS